jgi:hypothetical protein
LPDTTAVGFASALDCADSVMELAPYSDAISQNAELAFRFTGAS